MIFLCRFLLLSGFLLFSSALSALELQGVLTNKCRWIVGLPIDVNSDSLTMINISGDVEVLGRDQVDSVAIYNVIENPFSALRVTDQALKYLRELYLDDNERPDSMVFAVRFIEDLVIFMSLDGQTHVHRLRDIEKLRPAGTRWLGVHRLHNRKRMRFNMPDSSERCPQQAAIETDDDEPGNEAEREVARVRTREAKKDKKVKPEMVTREQDETMVRPTRILADKISISELYDSFAKGYESLESFQERTYLYAKPFLYPKNSRLGLILFNSKREENTVSLPIYFQWSTGEAYRFQSYNVFGGKPNEFIPNAESIFAIRSDVKSHVFHGLFVGNIMGMPAGESLFLKNTDLSDNKKDVTVQPNFNYLAMMGGDYGPYSLSMGFFFPTFGIKVGTQEREVLGSSLTYALRAMYTTRKLRLRAIGSLTEYNRDNASDEDVLVRVAGSEATAPSSFEFNALFLRPGIDYTFTDEFKASADFIVVDGNYKEIRNSIGNDIKFQRLTTQLSVQQSFGDYITLVGYVNLLRHTYDANFSGENVGKKELTETRYFGTLEFVF